MGIFNFLKNKTAKDSDQLNDYSFIEQVKITRGSWNQYDFLLAAKGYGWDYILDSAEYMIHADMNVETINLTAKMGDKGIELIEQYRHNGSQLKEISALSNESSMLGIGGKSQILKNYVKIVWINQTRTLRIFSPIYDEDMLKRYCETVLRRSFHQPDAMKLGKPAVKN